MRNVLLRPQRGWIIFLPFGLSPSSNLGPLGIEPAMKTQLRLLQAGCLAALALACQLPSLLAANTLLVEAESFDTSGGWKADTQSVEQMGSVYMIAHGMGKPVADARTTVAVPSPDTYRVWVRTRNWVPGNWEAPGQFKLAIDGVELAPTFGTD